MSYRVENPPIDFLNKLADELDKVGKETKFLDVNTYNIPRPTDRFPYDEETEVEYYSFSFSYKEKEFILDPFYSYDEAFKINVKEKHKSEIVKTLMFTMKEKRPTLKKMWKELLSELEKQFDLTYPTRYFFNQWCKFNGLGAWYNDINESPTCQSVYELLTSDNTPEEIELLIENYYEKNNDYRSYRIQDGIPSQLQVYFYTFLKDKYYFIVTEEEVFRVSEQEEALQLFEEECLKALKEKLQEKFKKYRD